MWIWFSLMAFCSLVVGILALIGRANAEVRLWTKSPIETVSGKVAWIAVSAAFLVVFVLLARHERRKEIARRSRDEVKNQEHDPSSSSDDWIF